VSNFISYYPVTPLPTLTLLGNTCTPTLKRSTVERGTKKVANFYRHVSTEKNLIFISLPDSPFNFLVEEETVMPSFGLQQLLAAGSHTTELYCRARQRNSNLKLNFTFVQKIFPVGAL
jgi:hypothetical protein